MCDPITLAIQATPSWFLKIHDIEGLEIHYSASIADDWSVFGQLKEGGLILFERFSTEEAASDFVRELRQCWSHLTIRGNRI